MRYDTIKLDGQHYIETPEGYIVVEAYIGRVGIQQYLESQVKDGGNPEKVVNVMRLPEEVFCPESMRSMNNLTVTNDHPAEGVVNSSTWKKLAVGFGDEVTQDGNHLKTMIHITDAEAIKAWKSGRKEISLGYCCEDYYSPGICGEEKYDYIQKNIVGNHIALVDKGRCGGSCRTLDAENNDKHGKNMKIKIDGIGVEIADETAVTVVQQALEKRDSQIIKMDEEAKEEKEKVDSEKEKIQAEIEALKEKLKNMEDSAIDVNALVSARLNNAEVAKRVMGDSYKWHDKTDADIKKDCVAKVYPDIKIDGESADYIDGLYAAAATSKLVVRDNAMGDLFANAKVDGVVNDARSKYVDGLVNFGGKK